MGSVRKFSEIDSVIKETNAEGCVADTSALIAFTYYASEFEDDADFLFKRLAKYNLPIFVNVSVRHEYIDFERRIHLTEFLLSLPSRKEISNFLPHPFRALVGKYKRIIDDRAKYHELPLLTEREIKVFKREALKHRHHKGDLWTL